MFIASIPGRSFIRNLTDSDGDKRSFKVYLTLTTAHTDGQAHLLLHKMIQSGQRIPWKTRKSSFVNRAHWSTRNQRFSVNFRINVSESAVRFIGKYGNI